MITPKNTKAERILETAENYIYYGGGVILVVAAVGLMLSAVIESAELALSGHSTNAVILLLDRILLALMVAEIIYTVTSMAKKRHLDVQPFLIVGVIAAIRRMLVITAESTTHININDPTFQAALVELGLLALIILLLAIAFRLLPTGSDATTVEK